MPWNRRPLPSVQFSSRGFCLHSIRTEELLLVGDDSSGRACGGKMFGIMRQSAMLAWTEEISEWTNSIVSTLGSQSQTIYRKCCLVPPRTVS